MNIVVYMSNDDCLKDMREDCQNCSLCCIVYHSCARWSAHIYEHLQLFICLFGFRFAFYGRPA